MLMLIFEEPLRIDLLFQIDWLYGFFLKHVATLGKSMHLRLYTYIHICIHDDVKMILSCFF